MDKKEVSILTIFCLIVALWVLPSLLKDFFPEIIKISRMGTAMPPILGIILYSIISFDGKPLLNFAEGMKKGVQWPSVIMGAGTLAAGSAMTNSNVGLTQYLIDVLSPALQGISPILLILAFTAWACLQTNFSSNMVTVTVVTTVAIPLIQATNGAISCPAIVAIIGMMSAYAFATPPAMPHVAMAIGSGWSDTSSILKYGFLFMAIATLITVVIGYPIAAFLM
ncbi:anion permease [Fusobacterium sp.]|uniref:anion permease n=1 Tax=Fusobacterium sp. TaxID=68766 RepID=UPI0029028231|nr:anion permease [Fusobacterium sp.]MDU1909588.1 anion permease [Fusobacterium sp.]